MENGNLASSVLTSVSWVDGEPPRVSLPPSFTSFT